MLNRFCVQAAIGYPLTVYGKGGQTRGFLDIRDTVRCIEIACHNPAARANAACSISSPSSFQCWNWRDGARRRARMGLNVEIDHLPDPRVEAEDHYYNAKHSKLIDLGLKPHLLSDSLLDSLMNIAIRYRDRIDLSLIPPRVNWRDPSSDNRLRVAKSAVESTDETAWPSVKPSV